MKVTRYSQSFKMQVVQEVESGSLCAEAVRRKYNIRGSATVLKWVRRYGSGTYGKIIRVETPNEVNELQRLRAELGKAKVAIADLPLVSKLVTYKTAYISFKWSTAMASASLC